MRTSDKTFNLTTRNVNKDKIFDEKWPSLFGLLEETNNTTIKMSMYNSRLIHFDCKSRYSSTTNEMENALI